MVLYVDLLAICDVFTLTNLIHAVSGGLGGAFAITVFFPLETVRTRLQVDTKQQTAYSPLVAWRIFKDEGLHGLYRGWLSLIISLFFTNFCYFYVFHGLKAILCQEGYNQHVLADLIFGVIAGSVAVLVTNPLWVVNTRLKLQGAKLLTPKQKELRHPKYTGMIDCLRKMSKYEGVCALWSGTVSSLMLVSNPAVQFMVYEALKRNLLPIIPLQVLQSVMHFHNGAVAKVTATVVTYPLQVVQTRVRAGYGDKRGVLQNLLHLVRENGLLGLFRGLESKLTQTVLTAALMFVSYEKISTLVLSMVDDSS